MNWKRFWSNPYKWGLWHWIGGRPWTYIIRDFCYQNPMLLILIGLMVIFWLFHIKHEILFILIGMLIGHLFWGTKWRKGQKGD